MVYHLDIVNYAYMHLSLRSVWLIVCYNYMFDVFRNVSEYF